MNTEDFIRELTNVEEQYRNRPTLTFEVNISSMARDCRKHIEFLNEQIEKMKVCGSCKYVTQLAHEEPCIHCSNCFACKDKKENKWELEE